MSKQCVYCNKRQGKRRCPSLGGTICTRCCGENRVVHIDCPSTCQHLRRHEEIQHEQQLPLYENGWVQVNQDLRTDERGLQRFVELEYIVSKAVEQVDRLSDKKVLTDLDVLVIRLSPIEQPAVAGSKLADLVWNAIRSRVEQGVISRSDLKDDLTRLKKIVELVMDDKNPRAFLHGLSAHINRLAPDDEEERTPHSALIITPTDARSVRR